MKNYIKNVFNRNYKSNTKMGNLQFHFLLMVAISIFLIFFMFSQSHAQSLPDPITIFTTASGTPENILLNGYCGIFSEDAWLINQPFNFNVADVYVTTFVFPGLYKTNSSLTDGLYFELKNDAETTTYASGTILATDILTNDDTGAGTLQLNHSVFISSTSTIYRLKIHKNNWIHDTGSTTISTEGYVFKTNSQLQNATASSTVGMSKTGYQACSTQFNQYFGAISAVAYGQLIPNTRFTFLIPQNNGIGKDFDAWNFLGQNVGDITSLDLHPYITIKYGSNPNNLIYQDTTTNLANLFPTSIYVTGGISIRKKQVLQDNTTWYANLYLYDDTGLKEYTGNISFLVSSTAPTFQSQIVDYINNHPELSNIPPIYHSSSSPERDYGIVGNMIVAMLKFLFQPTNLGTDVLSNAVLQFHQIFPFNVMFNLADTVEFQTHQATTTPSVYFPLMKNNNFQSTTPITIISGTAFNGVLNASTTESLFNLQRAIIWLGTGLTMLSFII